MKVSEVTAFDLLDYLREDSKDEATVRQIEIMHSAALAYMQRYTGQSSEYIEKHEEFVPVLLVLVADMYDTRSYRVDNDKLNPFAASVLDMHRINFL